MAPSFFFFDNVVNSGAICLNARSQFLKNTIETGISSDCFIKLSIALFEWTKMNNCHCEFGNLHVFLRCRNILSSLRVTLSLGRYKDWVYVDLNISEKVNSAGPPRGTKKDFSFTSQREWIHPPLYTFRSRLSVFHLIEQHHGNWKSNNWDVFRYTPFLSKLFQPVRF